MMMYVDVDKWVKMIFSFGIIIETKAFLAPLSTKQIVSLDTHIFHKKKNKENSDPSVREFLLPQLFLSKKMKMNDFMEEY